MTLKASFIFANILHKAQKIREGLIMPLLLLPCLAFAQNTDSGLEAAVSADYKLSKKASIGVEAELRTRNDFKTFDRWSLEVGGSYKLTKNIKIGAGYVLINDNNIEKINYTDDGEAIEDWTPSYWGVRHRVNVSLTESAKFGRFGVSLRERWQYTYQPEAKTKMYDFDLDDWTTTTIKGNGKNVLRTRLQLEYDINNFPVTPFASVELYNSWELDKTKYQAGLEWKISKKHSASLYYRFIDFTKRENNPNRHVLGVTYGYKL